MQGVEVRISYGYSEVGAHGKAQFVFSLVRMRPSDSSHVFIVRQLEVVLANRNFEPIDRIGKVFVSVSAEA